MQVNYVVESEFDNVSGTNPSEHQHAKKAWCEDAYNHTIDVVKITMNTEGIDAFLPS